jgi:hypothetical protein
MALVQFVRPPTDMDIEGMIMLQDPIIGESGSPASSGSDRRRSQREPVITVGTLRTASDTQEGGRQVLVNDVSLHGVGMRTTFELVPDEYFTIEIGVGPLHLSSRMKVVRVRLLKDGTYDIGGEFC